MAKWKPKPPPGGQNKFEQRRNKVAIDKWATSWGKRPAEQEDPHKNNPEPVYGGCGNPRCPICYRSDGSLKGDGRMQQIDTNGGNQAMNEREAYMRAVREAEEAARSGLVRGTRYNPRTMYMPMPSWGEPNEPPRPDPKAEFKRAMNAARGDVEKYILTTNQSLQWTDVIGNERARTELQEAIEASVTHAETYRFYNMTPPKGVMLWGPPGCGKTMFAKASAAAVSRLYGKDSELLVINGAELEAPIVGIAAQRVKSIFAYARAYHAYHDVPLTIFIDEADAVLKSRESAPWTAELVGTFLGEMDGLNDSGAFIILATNRPDELDQALLREGRIDRKIKITRPSYEDAMAILHAQLSDLPAWASDLSVEKTIDALFDPSRLFRALTNPETRAVHHFNLSHIISGAMVVGLLSRAKSRAFRRDIAAGTRTGVSQADMFAAVEEVYEENKGLNHDFALREFVLDVALPAEALKNLN